MGKKTGLSPMQKRFVKFYDGNGTEAAILAGYSEKSAATSASVLLRRADVQEAIRQRRGERADTVILSRPERLAFWSRVMLDVSEPMINRLRASELLGRAEADFVERSEVDLMMSPKMILSQVEERRKLLVQEPVKELSERTDSEIIVVEEVDKPAMKEES